MNKEEIINKLRKSEQVEALDSFDENRLLITFKEEKPRIAIKCYYKEQYDFLSSLSNDELPEFNKGGSNYAQIVTSDERIIVWSGEEKYFKNWNYETVDFFEYIDNKYKDDYILYLIRLAKKQGYKRNVVIELMHDNGIHLLGDGYLECSINANTISYRENWGSLIIFKDGKWAKILKTLSSEDEK